MNTSAALEGRVAGSRWYGAVSRRACRARSWLPSTARLTSRCTARMKAWCKPATMRPSVSERAVKPLHPACFSPEAELLQLCTGLCALRSPVLACWAVQLAGWLM